MPTRGLAPNVGDSIKKAMTTKELYKKYFLDNGIERYGLFELVSNEFTIKNALYPGGFIHIAPSYFIDYVVYIDSDKNAIKFFKDPISVKDMINKKKVYDGEPKFTFIGKDYTIPLELQHSSFDLLISQYAGIISLPCKNYLKKGGILLVNDSHGDAGVANLDKDYKFIGVINNLNGKYEYDRTELEKYFNTRNNQKFMTSDLIAKGKGVKYKNVADNYIFQRIN